jgi:7-keto-8-aminopelargonate synthetase-like enzyme
MTTTSPPANWVESRIAGASDSLDRAFAEGLTGHVFTRREGKRVRLEDGTRAVEFVSCSYLGLEVHEALLAAVYGGRQVVPFTSVSSVHLGVLALLASGALPSYRLRAGGAAFLVERTAHASMQVLRGIMGQIGPVRRFDLGDPESLPEALAGIAEADRTPIVLVDGVGSMGGLIDVVGLRDALEPFGGHLYVDDAHGISIAGEQGAGYAFAAFGERQPPNVLIAGSLSKAFGGAGGFAVLPAPEDVRVLRKFANPLVFGHSIMLPMLAADVAAARLHLDGEVAGLQARLWANVADFDAVTGGRLLNAGLRSPIRGALFGTEDGAFAAARRLRAAGVLVLPAFFPTVARGTGLIRFAVSSLHERTDLERAAEALGAPAGGEAARAGRWA